ncbi:cilia- and flagella-associated protein 57-like [Sander lucioperca]|uniref:cilia- and flagella-associated protein 57-like n=1 Tax=Sander lucioperca TaxID=283035 RepID=UPI001653CE32|nr:cilia- and flagella-associated protein 57-like [Sander lucioperca]
MFKVQKQKFNHNKIARSNVSQMEVMALAKKVKTDQEEVKELKTQLQLSQDETFSVESFTCTQANLLELVQRFREYEDKKMAEEKAKHREELLIVEEQKEKLAAELEELRATLPRMDMENKKVVENLKKQLGERDNLIARENKIKDETQMEELMEHKELEMIIEKLKKKKKDLTGKVSALENAVKDKQNVIENRNLEICCLVSDNEQLQQDGAKEKENNAVLRDEVNGLKGILKSTQAELKETRKELKKANRENANLDATVTHLKHCDADLIKEREKNSSMSSYITQFKTDLQECIDYTSDPTECVQNIIEVKRRYIDNDTQVQMDENTEAYLIKAVPDSDVTISHYRKRLEALKHYQELNFMRREQEHRALTYIINKKTMEQHNITKELKETKRLLEKAKKPPLQKIMSWINKKVLRKNINVEPTSLLPGDSQPPVLPDDRIVSSVLSCTNATISSSTHEYMNSVIHSVVSSVHSCADLDFPDDRIVSSVYSCADLDFPDDRIVSSVHSCADTTISSSTQTHQYMDGVIHVRPYHSGISDLPKVDC